MKKISIFLLIITSIYAQINWEKDFKSAYIKAQKENKPIFVFMQRLNPPCRWCELMKKTTLKDKEISDIINRNFIAVKILKEKNDYPDFLKSKYVPTIFFLTKDKKVINKTVGYWDKKDFKSDLLYVIKNLKE